MASVKSLLPPCGMYRTTKALPDHEDVVPAGTLVYFHNHSDSGLPVVITPDHNIMNRWHFHGAGIPFRGLSWADSLTRLPQEGFYTLRESLNVGADQPWPKGTLCQLGYTNVGDPILFIAQVRATMQENDLFFSERGFGLARNKLSILEPVQVFVEPQSEGGHSTGTH